ncbi:MAG: inorganic diphosphatase [Bacilli bacterium]|nr:inorganic diphosphatase [Bacilli bacterium]
MNIWHSVSKKRIKPESFYACIEIPARSSAKYELDKESGALILDRVLYTSTHYPHNYGFIPRTLSQDGDPLDVLVICSESIVPLALVKAYPIGVLEMEDNGFNDEKIIAVAAHDPIYRGYHDISELPAHVHEEIRHFFTVYKELELGKVTSVHEIKGREAAIEAIKSDIAAYDEKFPDNQK